MSISSNRSTKEVAQETGSMLQYTEVHLQNAQHQIHTLLSNNHHLSTTNRQLLNEIDQLKKQLQSETYYRVFAQQSLNHTVQESSSSIQNLNDQLQKSMNGYSEVLEKYSFAVKELSATIKLNSEVLESKDREFSRILEEKKALKEELDSEKMENQNLKKEIENMKNFTNPIPLRNLTASKILEASKKYDKEVMKAAKIQTTQAEKKRVEKGKKAQNEKKMDTILEEEDSDENCDPKKVRESSPVVRPLKIRTGVSVQKVGKKDNRKMDAIQEEEDEFEKVEEPEFVEDSEGSWIGVEEKNSV